MDQAGFDRLAKSLAARITRRAGLGFGLVDLLGVGAANGALAKK